MSQMNRLSQCIDEIAVNDDGLRNAIVEEINEHLNGLLPWNQLSMESQMAYEMFELDRQQEADYSEGHYGHPDDDDNGAGVLEEMECEK